MDDVPFATAVEGLAVRVATAPSGIYRCLQVGLICAMAAVMARAALDPLLGEHLPFSMFFPALLTAALFGGWSAAALALLVTTLAGWFLFLPPQLSFEVAEGKALQIPIYVLVGAFTVGIGLALRGALVRLETHRKRHESLAMELSERLEKDIARLAYLARDGSADVLPGNAREPLVDRFGVLLEAHRDLSSVGWGPMPLHRLVSRALLYLPHEAAQKVSCEGPDVSVDPDLAVSLALCIGELASSARRRGVLSCTSGCVRVGWCVQDSEVLFTWIETDVDGSFDTRRLARRMASERLAWAVTYRPGLVEWTVSLVVRQSIAGRRNATAEARLAA